MSVDDAARADGRDSLSAWTVFRPSAPERSPDQAKTETASRKTSGSTAMSRRRVEIFRFFSMMFL